jgi:glycosyltransferase involved in cell wall biosynthesis
MHIAMVNATFPPEEGIGYYVYNLSQQLLERGHTVTVVCRGRYRSERSTLDGITVIKAPLIPVYPFHMDVHGIFVNRILRSMKDELDLIHAHEPLTPVVKSDTPLVSTIHTSVIEDAKQMDQGSLGELLYSLTARVSSRRIIQSQADRSAKVATVAASVAEELREYYGLDAVSVVGNGVNPEEFSPVETEPEQPYLLYVGRLGHRKGVEDLIDAAENVLSTHEIRLKVVGKGPLREKLTEMTRERGIHDRVDFLGHVDRDRLVELYQRATVHVIPSHYEGLPTVLLEAMACGRPVVATAVSGSLDVIEDGSNGVLVPARSPDRLATAVSELLDDPDRRDRLGHAARETVLAEYTWEAIADEYERLYREAIGRPEQPVEI